ncbi:hypothetical protein BN946_scf185033.g13 [Trametes cinnabarina]|uniref:SUN domain-containing protein n=1 Tax=Pycnoporus cinnabarinus TaxID=5643 RepID=A0A060SRQ9_PYCCI|nr:hypothetical protein BN946_scf185033.g13 [Trametes cinnabarina]
MISLREAFAGLLVVLLVIFVVWRAQRSTGQEALGCSVHYKFSATTGISREKTTYLEFAAPSPPHFKRHYHPAILKVFDYSSAARSRPVTRDWSVLGVKARDDRSTRTQIMRESNISALVTDDSDDERPLAPVTTHVYPPTYATKPKSKVLQIDRAVGNQSTAGPSTREPKPTGKGKAPSVYYDRQEKTYGHWAGTEGPSTISTPPVFENEEDIGLGDVFRHLSADDCQLWLRVLGKEGPYWRPVSLGYKREDSRCLTITEKHQEPSWVVHDWSVKRMREMPAQPMVHSGPHTGPRALSQPRHSTQFFKLSPRTTTVIALLIWTVLLPILVLCQPHPFLNIAQKIRASGHAASRFLGRSATPATGYSGQHPESPCLLPDIETILQASIRKAFKGPVLLQDYALEADGGKVLTSLTTPLPRSEKRVSSFSTGQPFGPEVVIDDTLAIGRCWSTTVPSQVGLSTPMLIHPTNVTIDHIPRELAVDIGRAPRRMTLWGVVDGKPNHAHYKSIIAARGKTGGSKAPSLTSGHIFLSLACFEYDINADLHVQTFPVSQDIIDSGMDFGVFVLELLDDWGASSVCLYRVRIHGTPATLSE